MASGKERGWQGNSGQLNFEVPVDQSILFNIDTSVHVKAMSDFGYHQTDNSGY